MIRGKNLRFFSEVLEGKQENRTNESTKSFVSNKKNLVSIVATLFSSVIICRFIKK